MAKRSQNLFEKAKKEAKVTPKQKDSEEIPGLEKLSRIRKLKKALEALDSTEDAGVKEFLAEVFTRRGMEAQDQPKSFEGYEGKAKANCQLRKFTSKKSLTDEERAFLEENGITVEEEIEQPERYVVAEKYANDPKQQKRASEVLTKNNMADFLELQPKVSRITVGEKSIREVFTKVKDKTRVKALLKLVSTLALRFSEDEEDEDMEELINALQELILRKK